MTDYNYTRKITKDIYERAMKHDGYIIYKDRKAIFSESELYGYGVYGVKVYEENGEYYCSFSLGDSCD